MFAKHQSLWRGLSRRRVVVLACAGVLLVVALVVAAVQLARGPEAPTPVAGAPAQDNERAYLDALRAIDPGLVTDEERALSGARNLCDSMSGKSEAEIVEGVRQRYDGGDAVVDDGKARQILAAMRIHKMCG